MNPEGERGTLFDTRPIVGSTYHVKIAMRKGCGSM